MTIAGGPDLITDGLILDLDAANSKSYSGSGTVWRDLSGNGYDGTLTNGPLYKNQNGGVISFDGTNDYVAFANTTIGSFNNATFSFGSWFYFDGTSQAGTMIGKRNDSPYNQYNMSINNDAQNGGLGTKLTAFANSDQNSGGYMTFNYQLSGAAWYYGVCVINNNSQKLYVNGVNVLSLSQLYSGTTFNISGKPLYVGALNVNNAPVGFFKSNIATAFLYNRALSASEVSQNYNALKGRFGL